VLLLLPVRWDWWSNLTGSWQQQLCMLAEG
jgi:hypothetical protein